MQLCSGPSHIVHVVVAQPTLLDCLNIQLLERRSQLLTIQTRTLSRFLVLEKQEQNYFILEAYVFYFKNNITTIRIR